MILGKEDDCDAEQRNMDGTANVITRFIYEDSEDENDG